MSVFRSLAGMLVLEVTCADPEGFLTTLQSSGFTVYGAQRMDAVRLCFQISRPDYAYICRLAEKRGVELKITDREGLFWTLLALGRRPVLVIGLTLLLIFSLWVPGRIFFVQVEGNSRIPAAQILEKAEACGISFGTSRRDVRSEHMKNALLNAMPELGWAGVNTYGCVAVITVRERSDPELPEEGRFVSSIIAQRDGIIQEMTVLSGSGQCKPGDAVKAGQVLISGYTNCGIYIQAGKAQGEVYAQTRRSLSVCTPLVYAGRAEMTGTTRNYSLIIGKKRINFTKDSGISEGSCAKIKSVYYCMLPGGFQLPVTLEVEALFCYRTEAASVTAPEDVLKNFSADHVKAQMVAGEIVSCAEVLTATDDLCRLEGSYICREMIGMERIEESLENYGKSDRKNHERRPDGGPGIHLRLL